MVAIARLLFPLVERTCHSLPNGCIFQRASHEASPAWVHGRFHINQAPVVVVLQQSQLFYFVRRSLHSREPGADPRSPVVTEAQATYSQRIGNAARAGLDRDHRRHAVVPLGRKQLPEGRAHLGRGSLVSGGDRGEHCQRSLLAGGDFRPEIPIWSVYYAVWLRRLVVAGLVHNLVGQGCGSISTLGCHSDASSYFCGCHLAMGSGRHALAFNYKLLVESKGLGSRCPVRPDLSETVGVSCWWRAMGVAYLLPLITWEHRRLFSPATIVTIASDNCGD